MRVNHVQCAHVHAAARFNSCLFFRLKCCHYYFYCPSIPSHPLRYFTLAEVYSSTPTALFQGSSNLPVTPAAGEGENSCVCSETYSSTAMNYGVSTAVNCGGSTAVNCGGSTAVNYGGSTAVNCGGSTAVNCGGSTAVNCGGSTAVNCGGSTAMNCGGSTAVNYGGSTAVNYGGSTAVNYGGSTAVNYGGSTAVNYGGSTAVNCGGSTAVNCGGSTAVKCSGSTAVNYGVSTADSHSRYSRPNSVSGHHQNEEVHGKEFCGDHHSTIIMQRSPTPSKSMFLSLSTKRML